MNAEHVVFGTGAIGLEPDTPGAAAAARPVEPAVRSLLEMQYQFDEPFVVDSTKITDRLGLRATPLEGALDQIWAACHQAQG